MFQVLTNLFEDVFFDCVGLDLVLALHARGRGEGPVTLDDAFKTDNLNHFILITLTTTK